MPRYRLPALMTLLACEGAGLATGETLAGAVELLTCERGADLLAGEGIAPRRARWRAVWPPLRLAHGAGRAAFVAALDAPRGDPLEVEYRRERARIRAERKARREQQHVEAAAD